MSCDPETVVSTADISNAKSNFALFKNVAESVEDTTTTPDGKTVDTLQGRLKKLGWQTPPVAYTSGISFTTSDGTKIINRSGINYAPVPLELPFTTTGTWGGADEDKFYQISIGADSIGGLSGFDFATVATMATRTTVGGDVVAPVAGQKLTTLGRLSAAGGGGADHIVTSDTPNGYDKIDLGGGLTATLIKSSVVNVLQWGVVGDDSNDDDGALQAAKLYCDTSRAELYIPAGLIVRYTTPLDFSTAPGGFVSGADQPLYFNCKGELHYIGDDYAVRPSQNLAGQGLFINSLRGPGKTQGDTTPGSGSENIGLYIGPNSGAYATVIKVTDFRHGIMFDGGYNNTVYYNVVFACDIGVHFRGNAALGYGSINNHAYGNLSGGPFTSVVTQPDRVERCNRIGCLIDENARGNDFVGNTEYSLDGTGAAGLHCIGDRNRITCYCEGHSDAQSCYIIEGDQNELKIGGGSALSSDSPALIVTGKDNLLWLPQNKGNSTTDSSFAPHAGQTSYQVDESTRFMSGNEEYDELSRYTSNWNMLAGVAFNATAGLTVTPSVADRPPSFPDTETSTLITSATDGTEWYTSNTTGALDAASSSVMVSVWLRRVTNEPKVSIFVRDQTTGDTLESYNTQLDTDDWRKLRFIVKTGSATNLNMRIAGRNLDSGTGYAFRVCSPYMSQTIHAPENMAADGNYRIPAKNVQGMTHFIDVQSFYRQNELDAHSVSVLTSNVLESERRPVVIVTDNAAANVVNAINDFRDNSELTIINAHSAAITLTTTLGEWPTNISLVNGRSIKLHKRGGLIYAGL